MQFTLEQLTQLIALAASITFFGFFSYHCGLRDKRKLVNTAQQKQRTTACENSRLKTELAISEQRAETNSRAIELLNDELEAANIIKQRQLDAVLLAEDTANAYTELTAHMKSEIEAMRAKILSETQAQTIRQAASQLLLTSQIMGAINNKESAATQRTLAQRLQVIVNDVHETTDSAPVSEAA